MRQCSNADFLCEKEQIKYDEQWRTSYCLMNCSFFDVLVRRTMYNTAAHKALLKIVFLMKYMGSSGRMCGGQQQIDVTKVFWTSDRWNDFKVYSRNENFHLQQLTRKSDPQQSRTNNGKQKQLFGRWWCCCCSLSVTVARLCQLCFFAQTWSSL